MKSDPAALAHRRQAAGYTIRSLGEASGVSPQRISDLEAAAVEVRPPTAKALADALECDIVEITDLVEVAP